jgi:hypothetical protein
LLLVMVVFATVLPQTTAQQGGAGELKHVMSAPLNALLPASLTALSIERSTQYPGLVRLRGSVEIKTPVCLPIGNNGAPVCDGEMIVRADEADFHEDTGEIQAHGNVRITPPRHGKN